MIIEIAGGGYPVHGWWFILIPVAMLVVGIVCAVKWDQDAVYSPLIITLSALALILFAPLFGASFAPEQERTEHDKQKTAALQEQGFENVDLERDSFTASQDGEYFSGSLLEIAENTFQVVEKVEVK